MAIINFPHPGHLNGSSVTRKVEDYRRAHEAIRELKEAMANLFPHGRDFQSAPAGSFKEARDIHEARCKEICEIEADMLRELGQWMRLT